MEFKFLFNFAMSMLGSLVGEMFDDSDDPAKAPVHNKVAEPPAIVRQVSEAPNSEVSKLVISVPFGHFAGVSNPSKSLAEAKRSAVNDVVRQILGSIDTSYSHQYSDHTFGNVKAINRVVDDRLDKVSRGIVLDVEKNIVKRSCSQDSSGRYVFSVLVSYPDSKISEMRRLSRGSKVTASVISKSNGNVILRITEANGVSVNLSSADVLIEKRNRFAKFYNFCVWKVPYGSKVRRVVPFDSVNVCGESTSISLGVDQSQLEFTDYLLGAKVERSIVLHGVDELGRNVAVELKPIS